MFRTVVCLILVFILVDVDCGIKHRDRGGHHREHESLLDKQERERNEKDRKKDDDTTKDVNRNLTCYRCDGDSCRDSFREGEFVHLVQCKHSCWKGVFVASVRRGCGNNRCAIGFQGNSALSNTCCQTSHCNVGQIHLPLAFPIMVLVSLFTCLVAI